jgi:hypothetical protein
VGVCGAGVCAAAAPAAPRKASVYSKGRIGVGPVWKVWLSYGEARTPVSAVRGVAREEREEGSSGQPAGRWRGRGPKRQTPRAGRGVWEDDGSLERGR